MIERKIVGDKSIGFSITKFIKSELGDVPIKLVDFEKTPLGERITIHTSTPGLVIGREGSNVKKLTIALKTNFGFENPQIKITEVKDAFLSATIVARNIANDLARFGSQKFKLTGFKSLQNIMYSGAMGCEIRITGKLPSSRAKSWRFNKGYLKKTGYVSDFLIDKAIESVTLKTGVVGIQVSIMLPNTPLPDKIKYLEEVVPEEVTKEVAKEGAKGVVKEVVKEKTSEKALVGEKVEKATEKAAPKKATEKAIPKKATEKVVEKTKKAPTKEVVKQ
ncbi:MAG: 30S ribosomal protein S3 [Nanoarchaeota archaeon]|nr:30S ribosomal protein S3 [Nanoarchaeota archaeon]